MADSQSSRKACQLVKPYYFLPGKLYTQSARLPGGMTSAALRNRNFRIYLSGSTVSLHGLWIYRVALGWYAWQLTGSELWVGIVAFTQFAPAVIFGPLFGVLADRFDRRKASILINTTSVFNIL